MVCPPRPVRAVLVQCPCLLHVLTLFFGWPARRAVAASVYPASRQVRMSEPRSGVSRVAGLRAAIPCWRRVRGSIFLSELGFCGATSMTSWTSNWPATHLSAMASRCQWRLAFPSPGTQARCPASVCCCPRFLGPVARSCRSFAAIASPGVRWRVGRGVFLSLQSSAEDLGLVQFGLMSKPLAIGYPSSDCRTRRDRRGRSGRG